MNKTFKQYLYDTKSQSLTEEVIHGGLLKMFKNLKYWFDRSESNTADRLERLEQAVIDAGGPSKFAIVVRRIPSIKSFILRHKDELGENLAQVVNLL